MSNDYYNTIETASVAEFKDRGSKFLAYTFPVESRNDFKLKLEQVKKEHPKATHHCFAYRLGLEGTDFRVSDDGEPSGTAGRPILGQIDSKQVTNTLVIVVRYFGGTLLGVPGLVHAYKTAAALAMQVTPVVRKPVLVNYTVQFDYTKMNEVMKLIKQMECRVIRQETQLFCTVEIGIPKNRVDDFLYKLNDIGGTEIAAS